MLVAVTFQVVIRSFVVDGDSMLPGLRPGDRLLVDQLSYRWSAPARGDLVVFRFPRPGSHQDLVKRVIGLPGDTVSIRPGQVLVNGHVLSELYVLNVAQYLYGPRRVPPGEYFVLGDNREVAGREISYDSHQWGFLPAHDIYGRVMLVYWPPGHARQLGL
jgi:signal peptidase I